MTREELEREARRQAAEFCGGAKLDMLLRATREWVDTGIGGYIPDYGTVVRLASRFVAFADKLREPCSLCPKPAATHLCEEHTKVVEEENRRLRVDNMQWFEKAESLARQVDELRKTVTEHEALLRQVDKLRKTVTEHEPLLQAIAAMFKVPVDSSVRDDRSRDTRCLFGDCPANRLLGYQFCAAHR
jgi:hypothetical protein